MEITKLKSWQMNKTYTDELTEAMRDYVKQELPGLDTPHSFMYLFRCFGSPNFTNEDEYKILYEYVLGYKDIIVTIHSSYHTHVYFSLYFKRKYLKSYTAKNRKQCASIVQKHINQGVCFCEPTNYLDIPLPLRPKRIRKKNDNLFNKMAKVYFSKEDYDRLVKLCSQNEEWSIEDARSMFNFRIYVYEIFLKSLSSKETDVYSHQIKLSDIPEIAEQVKEFVHELKKGYYIRDIPVNILGYESKTNEIIFDPINEELI